MSDSTSELDPFEVVAESFLARYRAGERPSVEEYAARHPELAGPIRELFPAMVRIERDLAADGEAGPGAMPTNPVALEQLGDYRITREIGRGGMGVVYEAEQVSLGRRVALKVLPAQVAVDGKALGRFRREAKAAARLHHTNIVPVFEVGLDGETAFYAMQFIEGQSLDRVIDELSRLRGLEPKPTEAVGPGRASAGPPPGAGGPSPGRIAETLMSGRPATRVAAPSASEAVEVGRAVLPEGDRVSTSSLSGRHAPFFRSVARVGRQAAQGLAYAHAAGILHRDIKPSNLLLDRSGVVWIADFGLAKGEDDGLTQSGDILGTIRYMAPERFNGRGDARADVYALGLTLYELLTLRPALDSSDRLRLVERIKNEEPPRPRSVDPRIPRDLETIVLKAIEKDPGSRYRTAEAMGEDLGRFLADEPITARRVGAAERYWRWARRNPAVAALAAALGVMLVVMTVGSAVAAAYFRLLAGEAIVKARQLEQQLYLHRINLARHEAESDIAQADGFLSQCPPSLRGWEWRFLKRFCHLEELTLGGGRNAVNAVAFTADGGQVITGAGKLNSGARRGDEADLIVWDARTGEEVRRLEGLSGGVNAVATCRDRRLVAAASGIYEPAVARLTVWDLSTGRTTFDRSVEETSGLSVALSADGRTLAAGLGLPSSKVPGRLALWDVGGGGKLADIPSPPGGVNAVAFSPDGTLVAAASSGVIELWDIGPLARGGPPVKRLELRGQKDWTFAVAFSPDGRRIASGGWDRTVRIWEVATGQPAQSINVDAVVFGLAFSPDGKNLAVTRNAAVALWDPATDRLERFYRGHLQDVGAVAFSPDGRRLLSGSFDGTAKLWDVESAVPAEVPTRQAWVNRLLFTPDGSRLFSGSSDHSVVLWDPVTWRRIHSLTLPDWVHDLALTPDRTRLATADLGSQLAVWDTATWERVHNWGAANHRPMCVAISPDGKRLAYATKGLIGEANPKGIVQVWDLPAWRELIRFEGHDVGVYGLAFDPTGRIIASVGGSSARKMVEVKLWEADTGRMIHDLEGHADTVLSVAFSPDGSRLATAGRDGSTRVWDPATGRPIWIAEAAGTQILCLTFSPDGSRIATGDDKKAVRILDATTGDALLTLPGASSRPLCLAFSPDGRQLLCGTIDGMIRIWDSLSPTADAGTSRGKPRDQVERARAR